jgi:hypothetical protein
MDAIKAICNRDDHSKWELYSWDISGGLKSHTDCNVIDENTNTQLEQLSVLDWFAKQEPSKKDGFQILVLKDFHKFMGADDCGGQIEIEIVRNIRNQCHANISKPKCLIIMGTSLYLPSELEKLASVIDWPLPERYHIEKKIIDVLKYASNYKQIKQRFTTEYSQKEMSDIVTAFQGLTLMEIDLLSSYMVLTTDKLDPVLIANRKRDIIRKSGLVDWVDVGDSLDSIGGLYELKDWLMKRRGAFSQDAIDYGLPSSPKGVLLVGVQGAGKSLVAQSIAAYWDLPLIKLDMGKIFAGIVGSSEENIRNAIKVAESIAPCIIWLDEIDKGLSGTRSSNNTDGGTAARVFGSLLNWMQEKSKPVYIAATANDISQLPPELLRKGRFDEIFFVDLPIEEERSEIFNIHLSKRKRNPSNYDLPSLVDKSNGYTGAEIEASIVSAMYEAFYDGRREVTTKDIIQAISDMVPLSVTMKEHIKEIRNWAENRSRNASFSSKSSYYKHVDMDDSLVNSVPKEEEL